MSKELKAFLVDQLKDIWSGFTTEQAANIVAALDVLVSDNVIVIGWGR